MMNYINKIKELEINNGYLHGRHVHHIKVKSNQYAVSFWIGEKGEYLNGLQFKRLEGLDSDKPRWEMCWTCTEPQLFYEKYCGGSDLRFIEYSKRFYGDPKLDKPKELKGIKQIATIPFIEKKCICPMFIVGNDVWIKHSDYFSETLNPEPHEIGMPLDYFAEKYMGKDRPKKFIYGDAWGSVVLRNEAWIKIENLIYRLRLGEFELDILNNIMRQKEHVLKFRKFELLGGDMEKFYEKVISETKKHIVSKEVMT